MRLVLGVACSNTKYFSYSNIGEQNIVKGKRLKGQLKAYTGFLADIIRD